MVPGIEEQAAVRRDGTPTFSAAKPTFKPATSGFQHQQSSDLPAERAPRYPETVSSQQVLKRNKTRQIGEQVSYIRKPTVQPAESMNDSNNELLHDLFN